MYFTFAMSFYEFCAANGMERYSKKPAAEQPMGLPDGDSLRVWRKKCAEQHEALCKISPFDPIIETSGGFMRVSQKFDRPVNGTSNV